MNLFQSVSSLKQGLAQVLFGLMLLAGSSVLLHLLDGQRTAVARAEQLAYLPKGDYLKLAVLGYRQVVADLIWLQAVQHIGAKRDTQRGYSWTYHAVDVLTDLDPTFVPPYQATGLFLGVLAGRQEEGLAILNKGSRHNPLIWQLPFLAGYISYYERCDAAAAGEYFRVAAQVPGAPAYLPQLAARMTVESGDSTAALEFLDRFSRSVTDERLRESLLRRMKEIVQEQDLRFLEASIRRYRARYGQGPAKLEDLMLHGIISQLPEDPLGGHYEIDFLRGTVSASSKRERLRIHEKVACQVGAGAKTWAGTSSVDTQ
ncbi:MAG: hypothetical protein WAU44_18700 [Nitrospira sp.]|jgi:hypothetical protein|uniref:hypothetical protein n=1 Tax=Nitrospira sp. ND1 TaxID=1658518 RepID=UPI0009BA96B0|nr:hypothetical protein [Nitrospira sp. ND1]MBK7420923.1 hypothetical protein [Nitrospira sp.]MBK8377864.1 hypothetical protein [Nitrospira sp.]MBP6198768.1 hypothetical protein [Nitrospira sp.]MBP6206032.1 hypothetical protein [Nitrospira sp.]MBP8104279.1 hypothetical protein [Nitrospira sp.]